MRARKRFALFAPMALLGLAGTLWVPAPALASHTGGPEESPVHGIPVGPGLYRLHGTDPELPYDDLEPLHFILRNATFVGLGESIHTNGGFYRRGRVTTGREARPERRREVAGQEIDGRDRRRT